MRESVLAAATLGALIGLGDPAAAADQPIDAVKLVIRRTPTSEKLVFLSKDPAFLFPNAGGPDDPTTAGAVVELVSQAEGAVSLNVPSGSEWTTQSGGYVFSNPAAPGGSTSIRVVKMKEGVRLRVVGRSADLSLSGPQGQVAVRITTGSLRNCALFDAATIRDDEAGKFVAKDAVAASLPDCSDAAMGVPTTTSTTSTTSTTVAPVCGDGEVNQPGEQCDSPNVLYCESLLDIICRAPGTPGECTCCGRTAGSACVPAFGIPCCEADDICIVPGGFVGTCASGTCDDPGENCAAGTECQAGVCCAPLGEYCLVPSTGLSFSCCQGECSLSDGTGLKCCLGAGTGCSDPVDCCSGSCNAGTSTCDP